MRDVATGGRTVLFVSHNMSAVSQLTSRAILLSNGSVEFNGPTAQAIERYTYSIRQMGTSEFDVRNAKRQHRGSGDARILSLRFDRPAPHFEFKEPIRYIVRLQAKRAVERLRVSMTVFSGDGAAIGSCFSPEIIGLAAGQECELVIELAPAHLAPGYYFCGVSIGRGSNRTANVDYDIVTDTLFFEVGPEKTAAGAIASWARGWGSMSFPDLAIERKPQ